MRHDPKTTQIHPQRLPLLSLSQSSYCRISSASPLSCRGRFFRAYTPGRGREHQRTLCRRLFTTHLWNRKGHPSPSLTSPALLESARESAERIMLGPVRRDRIRATLVIDLCEAAEAGIRDHLGPQRRQTTPSRGRTKGLCLFKTFALSSGKVEKCRTAVGIRPEGHPTTYAASLEFSNP